MTKAIDSNVLQANENMIALGDIQSGDRIIEKNIENMSTVFSTSNYYIGLSQQQYNQLVQDILSQVKCLLEERGKENIVIPNRDVFISAMQSLLIKFERDDIKKMFINLLVNSMDKSTKENVHPSYVDILKNMDSLDALLFKKLIEKRVKYIKAIKPNIFINETNRILLNVLPEWYTDVKIPGYDMFQLSTHLVNLDRLGIITLIFDRTAGDEKEYKILEQSDELLDVLNNSRRLHEDITLKLGSTACVICISDYGQELARICL